MMLSMMIKMMPFMMPIVWAGIGLTVFGIVLFLISLLASGAMLGGARLAGKLVIALGVFFVLCQAAGWFLGVPPSINIGDQAKFEFVLIPFWQVGAAGLIAGYVLTLLARYAEK